MRKIFKDKRIILLYFFSIIFLILGVTYALESASISFGLSTAVVRIDETAYGSTTFDSSDLNFVPILDSEVETSEDNVIKIDFTVGGASTNSNENIIYDIALVDLDVNCNLLSSYIKWKLVKDGEEISNGSLDYKFDTIDENGRLVLTNIQEDLPDYSNEKVGYDNYSFYMWFSDSCQSTDLSQCLDSFNQNDLIGQNLSGKIEVELYTEGKKELVRNPSTTLAESGYQCSGLYTVNFNTNGGSVSTTSKTVTVGSNYGELPTPAKTQTITFDTNGGEDIVDVDSASETFDSGSEISGVFSTPFDIPKVKLMENEKNTKTVTYQFEGWYLDKELTIPVTSNNSVSISQNHELYAKWSGDNTIILPSVTKNYNDFLGWYADSEFRNKIGDAGDTYRVIDDKILYAKWYARVFPLYLKNDGGTGGTTTIYVVPGEGFYSDIEMTNKITKIPELPTRTGYTFNGYEGLTDGEGNIIASSNDYSTPITINGTWTIKTYTVTYDNNLFTTYDSMVLNGVTISYDPTTSNVTLNGTMTTTTTLLTLGNTFVEGEQYRTVLTYVSGSYTRNDSFYFVTEAFTSTNGTLTSRNNTDLSLPTTGSTSAILTASSLAASSASILNVRFWVNSSGAVVFNNYVMRVDIAKIATKNVTYDGSLSTVSKPSKGYTVTYNANGGSVSPSSSTASYTFGGYYTGVNGGGVQYHNSEGVAVRNWDIDSNSDLYAKWTPVSITLPTPSRTGYSFTGWYTAASGGTKIGGAGATYTPTYNLTVYAQWVDNIAPSAPTVSGGSTSCIWSAGYAIYLSSSDSGTGVSYYQVDWNGDGVADSNITSSPFIPWHGYTSCNNRFRAVDAAGNVSSWTSGGHIHMDTSAPGTTSITFNGGANTCTWKNNYKLTLSATDSGGGVSYYQIDTNGDGVADANVANPYVPGNGHHSHDNRFRAVDAAGNVGAWSSSVHIHQDTAAPGKTSVNLNGYTSGSSVNADVTMTPSATDNVGIAKFQYSHDGSTWTDWPNTTSAWTITWNGSWNFYVRAVDHAGNVGASSDKYVVTVNKAYYNATTGVYTTTLANAISGAAAGNTIQLVYSLTDSTGKISKNLTLNLNGKTLTRAAALTVNSGITATINANGGKITTSTGQGINNLGTLTINGGTYYSSAAQSIRNTGTITVVGATIYSDTGNAAFQNGTDDNRTGTAYLNNCVIYNSSTGHAVRNFSTSALASSICTETCSIHIHGTTQVKQTNSSNTSGYAVMNEYGYVHAPQTKNGFTGYFYSKNYYVLRNASSGTIKVNGGTIYAKSSSYYKNNTGTTLTIGSGVSQKTGSP